MMNSGFLPISAGYGAASVFQFLHRGAGGWVRRFVVRSGKGQKDRRTTLPESLGEVLEQHLRVVHRLHARDRRRGFGRVSLPDALYTHVLNRGPLGVRSPADRLPVKLGIK